MVTLIDTSLWIDFTRARSPVNLKQLIAPHILDTEAHLTDPIAFEVLRHATPQEDLQISRQFQSMPSLPVPEDLWPTAASLGQNCRQHGLTVGSLDLLIACVALHHGATLVTFDDDFLKISSVTGLQVRLLKRPESTVA